MAVRFPILNGVLQSNLDCGGYTLQNAVVSSSGSVSSFNGATGDVTGVGSFNGATGDITFASYVASFNGSTGAVTGVSSVNGSTGAVTGLLSYAAYNVSYSAGLTSDAGSMAMLSQVSMAMTGGNLTLNPPSSPQAMQRIIYLLGASGAARTITVNSSIKSPTGSTFSGTCASGSTRYIELTYIDNRWAMTSNLEFTA